MAPRENRPLQRQKRNPMKKTVPAHTRSGDQTSPHRLVDGYPVHRKAHEPTVDQAAHRGTHARPQQGPSHLGPRKPEDRREQRDGPSMSDRHNPPVGEAVSGRNPWRWIWVLPRHCKYRERNPGNEVVISDLAGPPPSRMARL